MAQYGKYQLEGSHDQRICIRSSKREKKAFKYYLSILERKERWLGHILREDIIDASCERSYRRRD